MVKAIIHVAIVVMALSLSTSAVAHDHGIKKKKQANAAVTFRKSVLQLIRANMGPLGAMAKGQTPYNAAAMQTHGLRIEQLGIMMTDHFKPDTRTFDVMTSAKDEIWENWTDFKAKTNDMVAAAVNLQAVAAAGDESNYRKAIGALGGTCKACHDQYKKD